MALCWGETAKREALVKLPYNIKVCFLFLQVICLVYIIKTLRKMVFNFSSINIACLYSSISRKKSHELLIYSLSQILFVITYNLSFVQPSTGEVYRILLGKFKGLYLVPLFLSHRSVAHLRPYVEMCFKHQCNFPVKETIAFIRSSQNQILRFFFQNGHCRICKSNLLNSLILWSM